MRLTISVDGQRHEIDSTDPELLGRWVVEIFERTGPFTPATYCTVQAYPSWVPSPDGRGRSDWIADARYFGDIYPVQTPREMLEALGKQLDKAEAHAA